ncbi:MAG TPA: hypothetical protein PK629_08725 [Oscillospiraceae bacterium]|nr:hypothetical protein [Oscillospiraceae bacterium]HPF55717.1 hypothetical protein [Clostridiales bacterium]HPK35539.1 hypothetical protein [Oscillospiraceae bacterium]HPR75901.1 hypothetical protein [Oscillospiraceae bacterium]
MKKIIALFFVILLVCGCSSLGIVSNFSEPMTQAEFDDFSKTVLPTACLLICGQQERDSSETIEIDGVTYRKISDDKFSTVKKLKGEFSKYFTADFVKEYFHNSFLSDKIYAQNGNRVYINIQNSIATGSTDVNENFYQDPVSKKNIIEFDKILNDNMNVIHYYFEVERVKDIWMIAAAQFNIMSISEFANKIPAKKPVIYFYPETVTNVTVKLDLNGTLGCTYPKYPEGGWQVKAYPDGKLSVGGEEYNYLFWEGELNTVFSFGKGFCVKGEDTAVFLKKALSEMGLIPSEYNDFIVYWLPQMEENTYNLISFVGVDYTDNAKLEITPTPDSILRVFMIFKPLESPVEIAPQTFEKFERNGFTVVEWGGGEIE